MIRMFKLPFMLMQPEGQESGPPADYNPDAEDDTSLQGDQLNEFNDVLDFGLGNEEVVEQIADDSVSNPKKPKEPSKDKKEEVKESKPKVEEKEVTEKTTEEPTPIVLTKELIKEYDLDDSFKPGDKVVIEEDEKEQKTEETSTKAEVEEETDDDEVEEEKSKKKESNQSYEEFLLEQLSKSQQPAEKKEEQTTEEASKKESDNKPVSFQIYQSEEELPDLDSVEGANQHAASIATKTFQVLLQNVMPSITQLVDQKINSQMAVTSFFNDTDNKDLKEKSPLFNAVITNMVKEKPELMDDYPKLLNEAAKLIRSRLPKTKISNNGEKVVVKKTAQPDTRSRTVRRVSLPKKPTVKKGSQQSQLDDILEFATE